MSEKQFPQWMSWVLKAAAIYNVLWGAWCIFLPQHFFEVLGMEPINHPMVWQGMGMVIGVYGVGYFIASFDPIKHWAIILVGLLGKLFGPLGFVYNYLTGQVGLNFGATLITNDLIWWLPFFLMLKLAYRNYILNKQHT